MSPRLTTMVWPMENVSMGVVSRTRQCASMLRLLGRMQQQLQLLSLAFPVKMLATLAILTALAPQIPKLFSAGAERTLAVLWRSLGF